MIVNTVTSGDARITAITDGVLPWNPTYGVPEDEYRAACPEADAQERLPMGLNAFHIAAGGASIVVDPCDWNDEMRGYFPDYQPAGGLMEGLAELGVKPADVTHVLITHNHADHFNGISAGPQGGLRFPNAAHHVGRGDWAPDFEYRSFPLFDLSFGEAERQGRLFLGDGDVEIVPGVTMMAAPGESAGHCVIRISAGGPPVWLLGDLVHHAVEFERQDWVADPEHRLVDVMISTRERLYPVIASSEGVAAFAHEPFAPWGKLLAEDGAYRWQRAERPA